MAKNTDGMSSHRQKVDREWMSKLLQKHRGEATGEPQQRDRPPTTHPALRDKVLAVGPMVEQSDLPFRLLCRRHGANLCYTPMIHARYFVQKKSYRDRMFHFGNAAAAGRDRPLIAQLCGNNGEVLVAAARLLAQHVDAVDVNLGCPTKVARRGRFGAYLLESGDYVVGMVRHLAEHVPVPVTVKVRLLPGGVEETCDLCHKLVDAGAALIAVHGRTRCQRGATTGQADWDAIRHPRP